MGQRTKKKDSGERLEIESAGEKVFRDAAKAMLFGIGISGAVGETGKTVFVLDLARKLRHTCHDLYTKITGNKKFTGGILFISACHGDLQALLGVYPTI
jgi:hypothetical protein